MATQLTQCPLCMETLDWDDLGFFPCSCGYQICRFCWHRLRTDENGLCPACRQAFPDIPVSFNPEISAEELKKQKKRNREKRSNKDQVFKPQDLATLRVVQKNLVFVIGLSSRLTQEDLKKEFAHFGKIIKFVHNKSTAYITYSKPEEAIRAIRTLNASAASETAAQHLHFQSQLTNGTTVPSLVTTNVVMNTNGVGGSLSNTNLFINAMSAPLPPNRLKASLGTTKYCNHFLRSQQCPKVGECMYLHEIAEAEASFTKEQMQAGKHVEYEKKLMDSYLAKMEQSAANPQTRLLQVQQQQQQLIQNNHHPQPLQQPTLSQPSIQRPPQPSPPSSLTQIQLPLSQLQSQLQPQQQTQAHQQLLQSQQRLAQQQHSPQQQQQQQPLLQHMGQPQTRSYLDQQQQNQQPAAPSPKQLVIDTDSEDDGLDFDPISVSTSGLRDLLDQQVQQAKQQLQMQNYLQQINSTNQTLANVLFHQNNRLNHQTTATTNGLIGEATFNGHPQALPFAGLNDSTSQPQQVSWQNLSAWATFLQRSGYGFENSR